MLPSAHAVELENSFVVGHGPHPDNPGKRKILKWEPDMVFRDRVGKVGKVLLFVDFESPNSSDFRVIDRDITLWYLNWLAHSSNMTEYLIITSLPDAESPGWLCRYTRADGYDKVAARKNPFRYWYGIYRARFKTEWKEYPITFANFNGTKLEAVDLHDF
jgi:hypothetical protein